MIPSTLAAPSREASAMARGRLAFGFTRRTLLLLLGGTFLLGPAFFVPGFVWAIVLWDTLVMALATLDGLRLPAPARIEARRTWLSAAAIDNSAEVELSILQHGTIPLLITAIDDLDSAFVDVPQRLACTAHPNIRAQMRYTFVARARGDHEAGRLFLRYRSTLGLVERWAMADLRQTVRIYPAIRASDENELFLMQNRQFTLELRKHKQRGLGRDFQSLREYRDGDDLRDICWTAAARRGILVSKQYEIERSQPVWVVMDAGRLLQARVGERSKLDYSTTAAFALARLAMVSGDRVGLLAYGRAIQQRVALGKGASHLRELMESLALVQGEPGEADHLRASVTLDRMQPRRSLILWLTDLAETAMRPEVIDGAMLLLRRHLVLFVAIQQTDLTLIAASRPATTEGMFERAAAQELVERRELLLAKLRQQGALTLETTPQQMTAALLNRYLEVKEKALI
jgi:uncharacterized protein (DUF58 family)